MKLRWIILLCALCGCFPQSKNPVLVSNFSSFYLDDTERQARTVGIDYRPALDRALSGDAEALHVLFMLTSSGALKDGGADSHAAMLWTLMSQWGDKRFSDALRAEPENTRTQVVLFLDYAAASDYSKTYPLTHGLAPHEVRFNNRSS
jgi:hypothetical protein